jgi:hypothetical protein
VDAFNHRHELSNCRGREAAVSKQTGFRKITPIENEVLQGLEHRTDHAIGARREEQQRRIGILVLVQPQQTCPSVIRGS